MRTFTVCTFVFILGFIWGPAIPILLTSTPLFIACLVITGTTLGVCSYHLDKRAGRV